MNPRNLLRRFGYGELINRERKTSYARHLSGARFPRFHAYTRPKDGGLEIHLHLDQKAPLYKSVAAHAGEYDGERVAMECRRIEIMYGTMRSGL